MTSDSEPARVAVVLVSIGEHLDYARMLLHDLINSIPADTLPMTAIAAEQSVEMDIRHATRDLTTLGFYLPKDGGAL